MFRLPKHASVLEHVRSNVPKSPEKPRANKALSVDCKGLERKLARNKEQVQKLTDNKNTLTGLFNVLRTRYHNKLEEKFDAFRHAQEEQASRTKECNDARQKESRQKASELAALGLKLQQLEEQNGQFATKVTELEAAVQSRDVTIAGRLQLNQELEVAKAAQVESQSKIAALEAELRAKRKAADACETQNESLHKLLLTKDQTIAQCNSTKTQFENAAMVTCNEKNQILVQRAQTLEAALETGQKELAACSADRRTRDAEVAEQVGEIRKQLSSLLPLAENVTIVELGQQVAAAMRKKSTQLAECKNETFQVNKNLASCTENNNQLIAKAQKVEAEWKKVADEPVRATLSRLKEKLLQAKDNERGLAAFRFHKAKSDAYDQYISRVCLDIGVSWKGISTTVEAIKQEANDMQITTFNNSMDRALKWSGVCDEKVLEINLVNIKQQLARYKEGLAMVRAGPQVAPNGRNELHVNQPLARQDDHCVTYYVTKDGLISPPNDEVLASLPHTTFGVVPEDPYLTLVHLTDIGRLRVHLNTPQYSSTWIAEIEQAAWLTQKGQLFYNQAASNASKWQLPWSKLRGYIQEGKWGQVFPRHAEYQQWQTAIEGVQLFFGKRVGPNLTLRVLRELQARLFSNKWRIFPADSNILQDPFVI